MKVGTGTLTLSGVNAYTGTTTVNAGTLNVNGSIASSSLLTVNTGGTVGGTGVLPSTVIDGGTLSPGNSIGTINVAGALQFSPAGIYKVELLGAAADKTNVTGAATLAGTVQVVPLSTTLQFGTPYTILTAAGGTIGQFAGATSSAPLTLTLAYVGNDVLLSLAPNLGGVNGLNINQRAVGRGLDQGMIEAGGTAGYDVLFQLPASQIPNALTQLSGELGTGAAPAGLLSMNEFLKLMIDPFAGTRGEEGATGPALGFAADHRAPAQAMDAYAAFRPFNKAPVAPPLADLDRWTAWGAAYGSYSRADGDGGGRQPRPHRPHRACRRRVRASPFAQCGDRLRAVRRQRAIQPEQRPRQRPRRAFCRAASTAPGGSTATTCRRRSPPRITTCRATAWCRCRSPASSPPLTARPASAAASKVVAASSRRASASPRSWRCR